MNWDGIFFAKARRWFARVSGGVDRPHNDDDVRDVQILLSNGLGPFLEKEIGSEKLEDPEVDPDTEVGKILYDKGFIRIIKGRKREMGPFRSWDSISQLDLMNRMWAPVFHKGKDEKGKNRKGKFGWEVKRYVQELKHVRHPLAHPDPDPEILPPPVDDVYRMLDTAYRLLSAIGAEDEAAGVERRKKKLAPRLAGVKRAWVRVVIGFVIGFLALAGVLVLYDVWKSEQYRAQRSEQLEYVVESLVQRLKLNEKPQQNEGPTPPHRGLR